MHVAVDEAGNDELPGDVDGLFRLKKFRALRPGVDDLSMMDGQIGGDESFQVGVEYLPAGKSRSMDMGRLLSLESFHDGHGVEVVHQHGGEKKMARTEEAEFACR